MTGEVPGAFQGFRPGHLANLRATIPQLAAEGRDLLCPDGAARWIYLGFLGLPVIAATWLINRRLDHHIRHRTTPS